MNSIFDGEIAELKVILRASEKGLKVSRPCFENSRYDLIIDDGELYRVQVKSCQCNCSRVEGSFQVDLRRHTGRSNGKHVNKKYYSSQIDIVIAYFPKLDKFVWLPPELWHNKSAVIVRYEPAKNGQKKGCIMLSDYEW